ncbi:MAG: TusE/DsrC/DsvC family sulfur relay protein [Gammaproteobacteria bacterium]
MALEVGGKTLETTETGFLVNQEDWNEDVGRALAQAEGLELTSQHWDLINYLRDEYLNNNGNQPNNRTMVKDMQEAWPDEKVTSKTLFDLFPGNPSKQAGRIAGLPESMRKGGY